MEDNSPGNTFLYKKHKVLNRDDRCWCFFSLCLYSFSVPAKQETREKEENIKHIKWIVEMQEVRSFYIYLFALIYYSCLIFIIKIIVVIFGSIEHWMEFHYVIIVIMINNQQHLAYWIHNHNNNYRIRIKSDFLFHTTVLLRSARWLKL